MAKKTIMEMYEDAVKDAVKEMEEILESRKFRRRKDNTGYPEEEIHKRALEHLLVDADKRTTLEVIKGIKHGKFADGQHRREDINELGAIVRDNIHDNDIVYASFKAMESMLNRATNYIKRRKGKKAVSEVNATQDVLDVITDLQHYYPTKLGKYTDDVYEVYKNMMKEYTLHNLRNEMIDDKRISDYYYGFDSYKEAKETAKEVKEYYQQTDAAWETKERLEAAKQRIYSKFTKKEVADYEKLHATKGTKERAQHEDAVYTAELKKFVAEHDNPKLRKKRNEEMDIAWSAKEILDNVKKDFHKEITDKEIAEWEKNLPERLKEEDAKYVEELKKFVKERVEAAQKAEKDRVNKTLRKAHQEKAEWILQNRVYDNDKALEYAYNEHKSVARKHKKGKKAKEVPISDDIPQKAAFIARVESKQRA